jgi:hypothetical protein
MRLPTKLGLVYVGGVVVGFAVGLFELSLGSFVLWGAIIGVALASFAKGHVWARAIGPIFAFGWFVALIVFVVTVVT